VNKDRQENRVRLVIQVRQVIQVPLEPWDRQENRAFRDQQANKVSKGTQVIQDQQESKVLQETKVPQETKAFRV
jgi:hypothetical protein